jgi:RNA polymerase sigma-70 factor (ECF subfamily)
MIQFRAMRDDELHLVEALQHGDRSACNDLVERYAGKIYGVALRLTRHPNEAEEVLQETFIAACRGVEDFQARSSLGTWLYRIATNNGLMRMRRQQPDVVSVEDLEVDGFETLEPIDLAPWPIEPEADVLSEELRQEMARAVDELPESLRAAFVLRDLEGLSTDEAAEVLDITPGALKVRLHRARLALRESLSGYLLGERSQS